MIIYCDPDEATHLSHLPIKVCEGLEMLTGADFLLSKLPVNPVSNIEHHLESSSIFVNIKRGYDLVVNHDQSKKFAARMQKLGVHPGHAILLGVGDYKDMGGKLSIAGYNKPASSIEYSTYLQCQVNSLARGLVWLTIPSSEHLSVWISSWDKKPVEAITVLTRGSYDWTTDIWQGVTEPPTDSVESILACGLPDFGPKKALGTIQFLKDNNLSPTLFNALMVLSACNEKGKRVFKIPMIGDSTFKMVRRVLYGDSEFKTDNLSSLDNKGECLEFALAALEQFTMLFTEKVKEGVHPKVAFNEAMQITSINLHELVPF